MPRGSRVSPLTVVAELLVHSAISTTAAYLTPSAADLQAATQHLEAEC